MRAKQKSIITYVIVIGQSGLHVDLLRRHDARRRCLRRRRRRRRRRRVERVARRRRRRRIAVQRFRTGIERRRVRSVPILGRTSSRNSEKHFTTTFFNNLVCKFVFFHIFHNFRAPILVILLNYNLLYNNNTI